MSSRRWYGVAVGVVLQAPALVIPTSVSESTANVDGLIGAALLVGYLLVPLATYLDLRTLDETVAWEPSTARWLLAALVPIGNVAAGTAYCLRRQSAVRGSVPGEHWESGVVAGVGVWTLAFAIEIAVDHVAIPLIDRYLFGPLLFAGLLALPIAVYLDVARVRGYTDWQASPVAWPLGAAVPYLGALVCVGYLVRRRRAFRDVDDPTALTLPNAGEPVDQRPSSPWFRGAAALFAIHFLLVVALAAGADVGGTAIELAAVLLWLPFGPFFAGCVYKDAQWRREHDREVGTNWYLYLLAALVQAAAFWYVLRRATKDAEASVGREAATESD